MSFAIALGGKGGTGKTTIAGLLIRYMLNHGMKPLLAIDADCNSNLNEVLGVVLEETLSDAREDMRTKVPTGMTKDIYMEMKVEQALIETAEFDLIAMGRPEGPGCYCAANNLLTTLIERLIGNYQYIVIDNEAGMEHFSRLNQKDIDLLVLVSDPSRRGLSAACRIAELVKTLPMKVARTVLVVNQIREAISEWPEEVLRIFGCEGIACLPADPMISRFDMEGKPTVKLPDDAVVVIEANKLFEKLLRP
ncbi:MAG: AAA family ATPase [Syntrophobacteraceae bacterium]|nr:AAA family ATPase [Syntrophobacteraceae bacterium]